MERPVADVEAVLEFLRIHGLNMSELALKQDVLERTQLGSFDFEKFLFVLPPVKVTASSRRGDVDGEGGSDDEFVSLDSSSTTGVCSSGFTNPYGLRSASQANSNASSDGLSQFGTARDYPGYDLQNDLYWYDEKGEGYFMSPNFKDPGYLSGPSEDKFIMTSETGMQFENPVGTSAVGFESEANIDYLDKPCLSDELAVNDQNEAKGAADLYDFKNKNPTEENIDDNCSLSIARGYGAAGGIYNPALLGCSYLNSKDTDMSDFHSSDYYIGQKYLNRNYSMTDLKTDLFNRTTEKGSYPYELEDDRKSNGEVHEPKDIADAEDVDANELLMSDTREDDYEVFTLRIIHRKNRTGFEESKDLPIVLNTVIAGRYYVTEYLGSAAFSRVVQAHDLHTGVDVCLKIIKNDKDFFDQSLDEIKLLKLVNKHDPADEHHILRLYDYFYHQEHLFIVCELLKANLYEFQKFNLESGGEPYFTLSRLQSIARQCLEALEYLHHLGIIHCDLKPENILIKSYRRCEIKVIDLGSSCFQSDNLCLYVQSRSYRAPEVMLGLPYDEKIDLWSLGCILAELSSGEVLFPNDAVVMILARIIGMLGPIDFKMLVRGQETQKYFTEQYDLFHVNEETDQLEYIIPDESSLERHLQTSEPEFIDFVRTLLEINPSNRPTAREALEHPWLSYSYESNS